jgi:predicted AlkP superfamily pyrophosphatase or phosphodiesterase
MPRRSVLALFVALAIALAAGAFKPAPERSAILISWDGAHRDVLRAELAQGRLPGLARLLKHGKLVDINVVGHNTDTKAGHAQILTGYDPPVSGVYSNSQYAPVPKGLSLFERLQQAFGKSAIATIMLTAKEHNLGSKLPNEPYLFTRESLTVWDGDQGRAARAVGQKAVGYIKSFAPKGRFMLFIHFRDPDSAAHLHNEGSPEYIQAIRECDRELGKILDAIDQAGATDRALVYVTSDHGFDPGKNHHIHAPRSFLATNDPKVRRCGQQRDIVPTVLTAMGANPAIVKPPLPGKPLN